jgi:hypothetical protein
MTPEVTEHDLRLRFTELAEVIPVTRPHRSSATQRPSALRSARPHALAAALILVVGITSFRWAASEQELVPSGRGASCGTRSGLYTCTWSIDGARFLAYDNRTEISLGVTPPTADHVSTVVTREHSTEATSWPVALSRHGTTQTLFGFRPRSAATVTVRFENGRETSVTVTNADGMAVGFFATTVSTSAGRPIEVRFHDETGRTLGTSGDGAPPHLEGQQLGLYLAPVVLDDVPTAEADGNGTQVDAGGRP